MSAYDPADEAFNAAKKSFRDQLNDQKLYDDILTNATTMDDVYQMAAKLQEEAASQASMRYLRRLRPFLDVLAGYAQVVDVFVQAKPGLLALIWGPIRLILKWSSELTKALDAIAEVTLKIAQALPQFSELVKAFSDNVRIKTALALFYGDILHFYHTILKVFRIPRWRLFWEVVWNQNKQKIDEIIKQIAEHALLIRNEVSVAEITKAGEAREKSLAHFNQVQEFQELQRFQGLRTRLDSPQYGERLDWLRNRVHKGSSKWLLKDQVFQEWLDISKKETTWLWIQGIPGSGKTYLAAAAVDEAVIRHQTLFVFASYNNQNSTTALSITRSFIFQIAAGSHILQAMVVGFSERDLESNGKKALELLQTLLNTSAGTYIIVDGLDEIEESERRILLQRLDDLTGSCNELKILICSRPKDDIVKALGEKSKSLRVDKRNMASIQGFVDHRAEEWIAHQDFDQNAAFEISSLLSPLAARANGMFLYARIVLDNLMELSSAEEIQRELKALPRDLDDTYHRVFNRINSLRPQMREKARKILSWIGCASVSMTSFEIEQAILQDASVRGVPSVIGNINFIKLCGPIVEIVNDKPQSRYIFNSQIDNFIDLAFANETLAIANVSYLCSGVLDLDSMDSKPYVRDSILAGNYRLLGYAAWYWVDLTLAAARIKSFPSNTSCVETLCALISSANSEVENCDFEPDDQTFETRIEDCNRTLQCGAVEGHEVLLAACRFRRDERQPDWTVTNADTWVNLDPLATSKIVVRVKKHFESLLCDEDSHSSTSAKPCKPECYWATLKRHYGPRLYKCSYISCPYSREGFISRKDRDNHEEAHSRLWKCPPTTCQFSVIGFTSQRRRDFHVKRFHQDESEPIIALDVDKIAASDFDNLDEHEIQPLLFVLTKASALYAARNSAAMQGSLTITQLLTPKDESYLPTRIVTYAVQNEDAEFAKWALAKTDSRDIEADKVMLDTPSD
ncbi:hypothetical protein GGR51DRAFT_568277 [Nemania sp. FL0031]|nr:hypothetical protein GGR51DRAFT_568277 [Nemania sp. FL0031]